MDARSSSGSADRRRGRAVDSVVRPRIESVALRRAHVRGSPGPGDTDITAMTAKGEATVEVSTESGEGKSRDMMLAFDGRPGSGWVPGTRDDDVAVSTEASTDRMVLNFKSPQPIALVCVVNGKASDWVSYMRADRARTVELRLGDGKQEVKRRTSLRTRPEFELQNRQDLEMPNPAAWWTTKASYNQVSLTLLDRYLGSQVDDPNTGEAIDTPTGLVMLAEVEVWVNKQ